jgi:hypothetical protein
MSTKKRRIATYIPTEIEDKFQAFKNEREVGDSQALILILTEFLGVSQQVAYLSNSLEKVKSELLTELKSELLKEAENLEFELNKKISELKSELLDKLLPEVELEIVDKPYNKQKLSVPVVEVTDSSNLFEKGLKGIELSKRLIFDDSGLAKNVRKFTKEEFADWSRKKDPKGIAWERREDKKYYPLSVFPINQNTAISTPSPSWPEE